jgi:lipopolysaccharide/colanic/teichoic acid biosynthesis glycosyltransferase
LRGKDGNEMKKTVTLPKSRIALQNGKIAGCNIFPPEEFKALVKYERARSDRNGSVFSIAVFDFDHQGQASKDIAIQKISHFSRSIDCIGLGEEGQIAVLLPDTVKQGADIFGKKVLEEFKKGHEDKISFAVYCYPDNWLLSDGKGRQEKTEGAAGYYPVSDAVECLFIDKIPTWKRVFDVTGASLMLIVASPAFLSLACYIKIVSPGPVFFKQTRIGYRGRPFAFWKFRTMKPGNNQNIHGDHAKSFIQNGDVPMEKLDDRDPRIIPGGKAIRKSCMDELPQLWNVLKGDMSLIGPRPCIPYEAREYLRWHTHRFDVLPGLSGLWQVSGKNKLTFKQMVRLDIEYCSNISIWNDLAILLRTPLAIMRMVGESMIKKISWYASRTDQEKNPRQGIQYFR